MKILIVSHNVISNSQNMGKTLKSYFSDFSNTEVFQFYIHPQIPTDTSVCKNYYRFTDIDALCSIFRFKKRGTVYNEANIDVHNDNLYEKSVIVDMAYKKGGTVSPFKHIVRECVWKMGYWFTSDLKKWIDDISPDVVFFASGNYSFMYDVVLKISDYLNVPIIMSCYDDYYIYDENEGKLFSGLVHKRLLKKAKQVFQKSIFATTVCEEMAISYEKKFNIPCKVLYTGVTKTNSKIDFFGNKLCFFGNVSLNRYKQLVKMGRALLDLKRNDEPKMIDVYSAEKSPEIIQQLCPENGIRFHGLISSDEVEKIMDNCLAVIHTESFESKLKNRVRFSISTKISDSLVKGPCLIAYGPRGIASIDYLAKNNAAYIIDSSDDLKNKLNTIIENEQLRKEIIMNARKIANKNHDLTRNAKQLRCWIENCVVNKDK